MRRLRSRRIGSPQLILGDRLGAPNTILAREAGVEIRFAREIETAGEDESLALSAGADQRGVAR